MDGKETASALEGLRRKGNIPKNKVSFQSGRISYVKIQERAKDVDRK